MDPQGIKRAESAAERMQHEARRQALELSAVLRRTAVALETSAGLAEEHARRQEQKGNGDAAEEERVTADRARKAASRARSRAEEWFAMGSESKRDRRHV